jgi:UPF0716 protein FxsA
MPLLILAVFIGVPLLEIAVFIQVGGFLGLWPTLAIVILTAVIGTALLRIQGLVTLARAQAQMNQGALPTRELFDGACLLIAGVLLLTPGFVTDGLGFLLFLPAARDILRRMLSRYMAGRMESHIYVDGQEVRPDRKARPERGPMIEGEFDEIDETESEDAGAEPRRNGDGGRRLRP